MKEHIRYNHLDGLRGVAALAVIMVHLHPFFGVALGDNGIIDKKNNFLIYYNSIFNGNFAVCIFFVLSGLALVVGYDRNLDGKIIRLSILKRYFRLTPLVFTSVMFSFILFSLGLFKYEEASEAMSYGYWLAHIFPSAMTFSEAFYQGVIGAYMGQYTYNGVLWTISKEFIGSFLLLFVASVFYSKRYYYLVVAVLSLYMTAVLGDDGFYYALFLFGSLILRYKYMGKFYNASLIIGLVLGMQNKGSSAEWVAKEMLSYLNVSLDVDVSFILRCIGAVLFVYGVFHSQVFAKVLSAKPFKWLGDISFSVYLFHFPIIGSFTCAYYIHFTNILGYRMAALTVIPLTIAISFIVSHIMWRLVDIPSQRAASRISKCIDDYDLETLTQKQ